jgi:hypothetical protein
VTTTTDAPPDALRAQAEDFAVSLGRTLNGVLADVPPVIALVLRDRRRSPDLIHVSPRQDAPPYEVTVVPLRIAGVHRLNLRIEMSCSWDRPRQFLTITKSTVAVETLGEGTRAQPLFRYEYERNSPPELPAAHLHVHAHRDETTWMMTLGARGRPKQRTAKGSMPVLSQLHFPLGGHRFRPCVEDVLEMVINEFGVEAKGNWRNTLRAGREDWRRKQLSTVVRDSQRSAADTLRQAGWTVTPPADGVPDDDVGRLQAL